MWLRERDQDPVSLLALHLDSRLSQPSPSTRVDTSILHVFPSTHATRYRHSPHSLASCLKDGLASAAYMVPPRGAASVTDASSRTNLSFRPHRAAHRHPPGLPRHRAAVRIPPPLAGHLIDHRAAAVVVQVYHRKVFPAVSVSSGGRAGRARGALSARSDMLEGVQL